MLYVDNFRKGESVLRNKSSDIHLRERERESTKVRHTYLCEVIIL